VRVAAFGSAAVLVVAGLVCAALFGGLTGQVLAIAFVTLGLGGALLLAFLEVGMSEDRERAREEGQRRRSAERASEPKRRSSIRRRPRRPS
jgi:threonine/homoserine/homoserine lactone efflux protein